ncbi:MAG: hypothetical protein KDK70_12670 [Myxococcales bacterium]|nr:hypothetical protein [Myxococcales bacterium]
MLEPRFPQPAAGHRDWYAFEAIRALPRILLMIDRNPLSPTYGCCDREYWHYKTVDFPCAMNQEFCLPLALAQAHPLPHNPYHQLPRLRELVVGIIEYAAKTTHPDGSCDDYFPFERALGAHVFTTYAMAESYRVLGLDRPDLLDFFRLRADWLSNNNESGQLANHQAFAALALYTVYELTGEAKYREASDHFRDIILSWQNQAEGWFQEYEGADPGYHSCSIAFLAKLYQKSHDASLIEPLKKAIEFATYFMHPDGSYAGEYGSRNTYHFYPHGFEVLADVSPSAGRIADTYLHRSMPERRRYYNDDNRMCAHYVYDWIQSWLDYRPERHGLLEDARGPFTRWFRGARLLVKKTERYYAVVSLAKGGVIKVYTDDGPIYSDTGPMLQTEDGKVLVSHLVDDHACEVDEAKGRIVISGVMARRRSQLSSPVKQIAFRTMNLTVGRYNANLVRSTLQKILITGKPRSEVRFRRTIELLDGQVRVTDELDATGSKDHFSRLMVGTDATSIYVANSTNFQESTLLPWVDLSSRVGELNERRRIELPTRTAGQG